MTTTPTTPKKPRNVFKPEPPKVIKAIGANQHTIPKALVILRHSAPSNDAESQAIIQLLDFAMRAGTAEINAVANYMAEAIVYNRVNFQHLRDAKNYRSNRDK